MTGTTQAKHKTVEEIIAAFDTANAATKATGKACVGIKIVLEETEAPLATKLDALCQLLRIFGDEMQIVALTTLEEGIEKFPDVPPEVIMGMIHNQCRAQAIRTTAKLVNIWRLFGQFKGEEASESLDAAEKSIREQMATI